MKKQLLRVSILATVVGGATIWFFGPFGGAGGGPLHPTPAQATDTVSRDYGYIDQDNGAFLNVQLNPLHPSAGEFLIAVPGQGLFVSDTPATLTVAGNGVTTVSYSGTGHKDAGAKIDSTYGVFTSPSGQDEAVSFTLTAVVAADFKSATASLVVGSSTFTLTAPVAAHTAEIAGSAFLQAFVSGNFGAAYDGFESAFAQKVSRASFVAGATAAAGASNGVQSFTMWPAGWQYFGEPGTGAHTAGGWVTVTASKNSVVRKSLRYMAMVEEHHLWKAVTFDAKELVTVSPADLRGWGFLQETATGTGSFATGPATPPSGTGGARLRVTSTTGGVLVGTVQFAGTRLDAIRAMRYNTYQPTTNPGTVQAISLQLDVDYDVTDSNTAWQGRLVFEPYRANTVTKGTWQAWDPLAGKWWATGNPGKVKCPQATPCTWAKVLQEFPNAGIRATVGGLSFKAGSGWPGPWDGYVDAFAIVVGETPTAFDFEPAP